VTGVEAGADTSGVAGEVGAIRALDGAGCAADTSGAGVATLVTGTAELETDGMDMG